jgi:hypothetical protein
MAGAFQKTAFQDNAFQIGRDIVRGGGGYYDGYWDRVKKALQDKEQRRLELQRMEQKIAAEQEALRLKEEQFLREREMSAQEAREMALLEARIAQLIQMKAIIEAQILTLMREEDELIIILYSMPFCLK